MRLLRPVTVSNHLTTLILSFSRWRGRRDPQLTCPACERTDPNLPSPNCARMGPESPLSRLRERGGGEGFFSTSLCRNG
jgi:hypothetical protein